MQIIIDKLKFFVLFFLLLILVGIYAYASYNDPYDDPSVFGHDGGDIKEYKICSCVKSIEDNTDTWRDTMMVPNSWGENECDKWCESIGANNWQLKKIKSNFSSPTYIDSGVVS